MIEDYFSEKYHFPSWQGEFLKRMFKKEYEAAEKILDLFPYRSSSKEDIEFREKIVNEGRTMLENKYSFNELRTKLNSSKELAKVYNNLDRGSNKRKGIISRFFSFCGFSQN